MKIIITLVLLLLGFLQYKLWIAADGVPELWRLKTKVDTQLVKNSVLRVRNNDLEAEVKDLKKGQHALEERARTELGMLKEDEVFYQLIIPSPKNRSSASLKPSKLF